MSDRFREKVLVDEDGCYITQAQLNFYLNGGIEAEEQFSAYFAKDDEEEGVSEEDYLDFAKFYEKCRIYNKIWDLEKDYPGSSDMFWDDELGLVIHYPKDGIVSKELKNIIRVFDD